MMNSNYISLISILLLILTQLASSQNIQFYPETDTVNTIDCCTGAEFTCTLSSFNTEDSIIITPGFNTYFEYLNNEGIWLPIDKVFFLIEDSSNTYQYELWYWPRGPLPYFTKINFDTEFTAWDQYFKIIVVASSSGTVVDSASQVFKAQIGLGLEEDFKHRFDPITLYPNYPNPFNNSTTIRYYLPKRSKIKLSIYNALGQLIDVLLDEYQIGGHHTLNWYAQDIPSGIYYLQLEDEKEKMISKCILLK